MGRCRVGGSLLADGGGSRNLSRKEGRHDTFGE